ncbi:MAG: hypothetical protein J0L93_05735 [Deltaproteobacteria bacterium]|nr:hypothetical protein [Deltaproteobacteria bacterium]
MFLRLVFTGLFFTSVLEASSSTTYQFLDNGNNITEHYLQAWNNTPDTSNENFNDFKNYKFLIIRGYFGNWFEKIQKIPGVKDTKIFDHFRDQIEWLTENDFDFKIVETDTEQTPLFNSSIIKKEIENSDKKVFIISQSKGGPDTLVALTEYPEIQNKVVAWLALNPAFQGTPLANQAMQNNITRWMMTEFFERFGGSIDSLRSLEVEERQDFLRDNKDKIENIQKKISIITLSTFIDRIKNTWNTNFQIPRNILLKKGYRNDGLLPWQSSVLPGADYVLIPGVDHATSIGKSPFVDFDRKRMMKTFAVLMREKINYLMAKF